MRVLHISNHSVDRCGVALFGRQCSAALRAEGVEVVDWDATYSVLHAREECGQPSYLPASLDGFDIIHLNWQPATINHYHPTMFPLGHHRYSVFLHDLPPWSTCPFEDRMQVKFALEPYPGAVEIPPPAPDYKPSSPMNQQVTIGRTNIRHDGRQALWELCGENGWIFNDSGGDWLSEEEEVERLARSWVNVVWYTEHRSRGSAAMIAAAARRPLLLSGSARFSHLWPYRDEYYTAPIDQLAVSLEAIVEEVSRGLETIPHRIPEAFGWRAAARTMRATWEAACV